MNQAGMKTEEIHFTNRVALTKGELIKQKLIAMGGMKPAYNFTYASSIVAIASIE
jgi:hypothetical protein